MISLYFKREEFACKCECGKDTVDAELLEVLTEVRKRFRVPVTITSAHRCPTYNKKVKGGAKSQHLLGKAADIVVRNMAPKEVYKFLNDTYPDQYGMGSYTDFTHIDVRSRKARWSGE